MPSIIEEAHINDFLLFHPIIILSRCNFLNNVRQLLLNPPIADPFKLTWNTQKAWMSGVEVVQYHFTIPFSLFLDKGMLSSSPPLRLLLIPEGEVQKYLVILAETQARIKISKISYQTAPESLTKSVYFIDNFKLSMTKSIGDGNLETVSFSFLLDKNHNLSQMDSIFPITSH